MVKQLPPRQRNVDLRMHISCEYVSGCECRNLETTSKKSVDRFGERVLVPRGCSSAAPDCEGFRNSRHLLLVEELTVMGQDKSNVLTGLLTYKTRNLRAIRALLTCSRQVRVHTSSAGTTLSVCPNKGWTPRTCLGSIRSLPKVYRIRSRRL